MQINEYLWEGGTEHYLNTSTTVFYSEEIYISEWDITVRTNETYSAAFERELAWRKCRMQEIITKDLNKLGYKINKCELNQRMSEDRYYLKIYTTYVGILNKKEGS